MRALTALTATPQRAGQLARLAVGAVQRQRGPHRGVAIVQSPGGVVHLRQLAPHRDRLRRIQLGQRLGQQRDVPRIARRRLQRRLQLGQREARVPALDVRRRQLARDAEVAAGGGTAAARRRARSRRRAPAPSPAPPAGTARGPPRRPCRPATRSRPAGCATRCCRGAARRSCAARAASPRSCPPAAARRRTAPARAARPPPSPAAGRCRPGARAQRQPRRQLEDALVDRHRLAREALLHVDLGGAQVDVARLLQRPAPRVDLRHLQPGTRVVRVLLDDARELFQRALFLSPLKELLSGGEMLVFLDQHRGGPKSTSSPPGGYPSYRRHIQRSWSAA